MQGLALQSMHRKIAVVAARSWANSFLRRMGRYAPRPHPPAAARGPGGGAGGDEEEEEVDDHFVDDASIEAAVDTMVAAQILGFRGRCLRVTTVAVLAWLVASMSTSGLSLVSAGRHSCHREITEKFRDMSARGCWC